MDLPRDTPHSSNCLRWVWNISNRSLLGQADWDWTLQRDRVFIQAFLHSNAFWKCVLVMRVGYQTGEPRSDALTSTKYSSRRWSLTLLPEMNQSSQFNHSNDQLLSQPIKSAGASARRFSMFWHTCNSKVERFGISPVVTASHFFLTQQVLEGKSLYNVHVWHPRQHLHSTSQELIELVGKERYKENGGPNQILHTDSVLPNRHHPSAFVMAINGQVNANTSSLPLGIVDFWNEIRLASLW